MIRTEKVSVTVAGADGSAAGTANSAGIVNGKLVAVYIDFITQPATADTTLATVNAPAKTLLTVTDSATDGWYYPRYIIHSEAAAALTGTSGGDRSMHPINDYVKVTVAQGNAGTVDVWFLYEQ